MNTTTVLIGGVIIAYGIFSGILRIVKPSIFKKLEPMKQRWGNKAGSMIHFTGYVVVPVAVGVVFIVSGMNGLNIFEVGK